MRPKRTAAYTAPSTGEILTAYFKEKRIYRSALGRKLNLHIKSILGYQKNSTIQTAILWDLSSALKHNFFMDIAALMPKEFTTSADLYSDRDLKIAHLEQEIIILKAEKEILLKVAGR